MKIQSNIFHTGREGMTQKTGDAFVFDFHSKKSSKVSLILKKMTMSLRKSLHSRLFSHTGSQKSLHPYTDEMIRLEDVIVSQPKRNLLVHDLIAIQGDVIMKIRFIAAVDQYENCENLEDRKKLGQKLIETFVEGGLFTISG